jgi:hypothetical protein
VTRHVALVAGLVAFLGCKGRPPQEGAHDAESSALLAEPRAADASTGAVVGEPPVGSTVVVAAIRSPTPIFSRPEIPARDPERAADEKKEVVRLGSLRKGQRVTARNSGKKGGHCSDGWFELVGGGWLCGRHVTVDFDNKELKDAPHPPFADRPLPYDYGLNLTNGTPMYRRAPLRRERAANEKGLLVAGKTVDDRAAAAKEIAAEKGETPWYLADEPQKGQVTLDQLKGESALVEQRMVRGFYVAIDQEVHAFAGKFWRTTRGNYVPFDHILVHQPKTEFEGVWVGKDDEPRKLPLAFLLRGSPRIAFSDAGQTPSRGELVARFSILSLTPRRELFEGRGYLETTEGFFVREQDAAVARAPAPPADLKPGEKWIDVNLATQTLVAFEGDRPVFATIVSSGRHDDEDRAKDHRTPSGSFRIREKHISTTMDDDSATDGPYSIEDVPWVMYFEKGIALHGAFWHSSFGKEHSHGCVNMLPHDARELFAWVGPTLPDGWHAVRATAENPGTRVLVHESP